ncbi:MAG: FkbM family methyltransferase [Terriglobales bacterium]
MLGRVLAKVAAATPFRIKRSFAWLKPAYLSAIRLGEPVALVATPAGMLRWRIDALTSQRYLLGTYEEFMQQAFLRFVRPGAVVYDIGAHTGFHALFCAQLVKPGGTVIAFEPDPVARKSLETQLRENYELPVKVMGFALSDHCGKVYMDTSRGTSESKISEQGNVEVDANSVDELIAHGRIPPPALLKIDVEGHEAAVLRGARFTLQQYNPVVLCDYNEGDTLGAVTELLLPLGYSISPGPPITALPGATDLGGRTCSEFES